MNLYERLVLPRLVHLACGSRHPMRQRSRIVPAASGRVLEIGFGSGLNLPSYDAARVEHLFALEPSQPMWMLAAPRVEKAPFPIEWVASPAESVPLPNRSIDTVVVTYTLCTVPDLDAALREASRVLKPEGRLLFCEHGEAPDASVRRLQQLMNPVWRPLAGGCNLGRPIPRLLEESGFSIRELDARYLPGFKPGTYNYLGWASPPRPPRATRPAPRR